MEGHSSAASITSFTNHYDKTSLSRRSVDWRDSGIVIDEDQHQFNSFDAICDFNQTSISNLHHHQAQSSATDCCPLQKMAYDQDDDGDTVLHLAVVGFHLDKVRDLIKICDLNAINNMMQTPMHVAVLANRPEMVKLLLASGAKLNVHDRRGNTPLHLACQKGHIEIVEIIFEDGVLKDEQKQQIEITNFDGQTCLHLAATNDRREIIEILVNKYNANLNCRDSKSGETIMHKAISKFNVDLVEFILKLNQHCNEADFSGREPLDMIRILRESRLDQIQMEKLLIIDRLVSDTIRSCIENDGCCKNKKYNLMNNNEILDSLMTSSSSSDYSDSDYDMN